MRTSLLLADVMENVISGVSRGIDCGLWSAKKAPPNTVPDEVHGAPTAPGLKPPSFVVPGCRDMGGHMVHEGTLMTEFCLIMVGGHGGSGDWSRMGGEGDCRCMEGEGLNDGGSGVWSNGAGGVPAIPYVGSSAVDDAPPTGFFGGYTTVLNPMIPTPPESKGGATGEDEP